MNDKKPACYWLSQAAANRYGIDWFHPRGDQWIPTIDRSGRLGLAWAAALVESPGVQYRAVSGRGSWSAAFRRPQFKHANTMIASPAFKSTARSGNIVPRHLSQVFMGALYHRVYWKNIHQKYWVKGGLCDQFRLGRMAGC
jgi:hypothetical protein